MAKPRAADRNKLAHGILTALDPLLCEEKKAFLKRAAKARDIEAVLTATPPCPPRRAAPDAPLLPGDERL